MVGAVVGEITASVALTYLKKVLEKEVNDKVDETLGIDNTKRDPALLDFRRTGSITRLLKTCIIEPNIIVSRQAFSSKILDDINVLGLDIFTAFYIQAYQLLCSLYGASSVEAINDLSTNKYNEDNLLAGYANKYGNKIRKTLNNLSLDTPLTLNQLDIDNINIFLNNEDGNNDIINSLDPKVVEAIRKQAREEALDEAARLHNVELNILRQTYEADLKNEKRNAREILRDQILADDADIKQVEDKLNDLRKQYNELKNDKSEEADERRAELQKEVKEYEITLRNELDNKTRIYQSAMDTYVRLQNEKFDNLIISEINDPKNSIMGGLGRSFELVIKIDPVKDPNNKNQTVGYQKVVMPMNVIASVNITKDEDFITAIKDKDFRKTLSYRWREFRSGGISFWDFIFCGDLIKEYRKARTSEASDLLKKIDNQNVISILRRGLTGSKGAEGSYNIIVVTEDEAEMFNKALNLNILTPDGKNKLLKSLNAFLLCIVNDDTERAKICISDLKGNIDIGYARLIKRNGSNTAGNDMMEFMQYLMKNQLPII